MSKFATAGRAGIGFVAAVVAAFVGWLLFVQYPTDGVELVGILLVIATVLLGLRIGGNVARNLLPTYNVAEVGVEGPITRDGGEVPFSPPGAPGADKVVDLVEQADADGNAEALLLRLNTPGGSVVPSDDIRLAADRFDGPTVAYATDVCASGGYWIASGCDELWAREGSIVGSIGVRGSRMTASGLLDKAGLEYEQLTAGEYKEAGSPFDELDEDERAYLQGIVDDYYDQFVERVVEGRELDGETVRATEARVYLGVDAHELELVDELGTKEDVEERLQELIDDEVRITEFEPETSVAERLRGGAERAAYAVGAGFASRLVDADGEPRFRI